MKHLKFAIYDSKAAAYLPDWPAINIPTAIRLFQEGCIIPESPYFKHPGDYTLMEVGTYDNETGINEKRPNGHYDHGSAQVHKSMALLELDFQNQTPEPKFGKTITNGDALRAVTKETTPQ